MPDFQRVEFGDFSAGHGGDFFQESGCVSILRKKNTHFQAPDFVDESGELLGRWILLGKFRDGADIVQLVAGGQIREGVVEGDEVLVRKRSQGRAVVGVEGRKLGLIDLAILSVSRGVGGIGFLKRGRNVGGLLFCDDRIEPDVGICSVAVVVIMRVGV